MCLTDAENNELKEKITLVVSSCDAYSDIWDGFFFLLKKQWTDCPLDIVLNTETSDYYFDGLHLSTFHTKQKMPWGKRLIKTLKSIKTKYILFMLDDFYLKSPIDVKALTICLHYMESNHNIANFSFYPVHDNNNIPSLYVDFEKRPQRGKYRLNCQIALWNKEKFIKCIRPHESPWQWEVWGSKRSARFKFEFYSLKESAKKIFDYENGGVISRGKWWMEHLEPIIRQYNMKNIDLSHRSIADFNYSRPKRSIGYICKKAIDIFKSLI